MTDPLEHVGKWGLDGHIALRKHRRRVSTLPRVANCCRHVVPTHGRGTGQVELWVTPDAGSGNPAMRLRGLQRCGSVWACPECSSIVARGRITEIVEGMKSASLKGWGGAWQTLTLPHDAPDKAQDTVKLAAEGWRVVRRSRAYRAMMRKLDIQGTIRKLEITHGENGWHPHNHVTYLFGRVVTEEELSQLETAVWIEWRDFIASHGYREPHIEHCPIAYLNLESQDWAEYIGKALGWELTGTEKRARSDKGRTPFQLLMAACETMKTCRAAGDPRDLDGQVVSELRLWREYERATRGKQQLVWSKGLKAALGVADLTDDDQLTLDEAVGGWDDEFLVAMTPREWHAVREDAGALTMLAHLALSPEPVESRRVQIQREVAAIYAVWEQRAQRDVARTCP